MIESRGVKHLPGSDAPDQSDPSDQLFCPDY